MQLWLVSAATAGAVLVALQLDNSVALGVGLCLLLAPILLVLSVAPQAIFDLLVVASLASGAAIASTAINLGVRLYPLDVILAVALLLVLLHARHLTSVLSTRQLRLTLGIVTFGGLCGAIGLAHGNAPLEVVGTFRRMFFYPIVGFVISMAFTSSRSSIERTYKLVIIAGVLLFLLFMARLLTGVGYKQDVFNVAGETTRYLSYNEAASLSFAVLAAIAVRFLRPRGWQPLVASLLSLTFTIGVIGSNYRTAWLALLAGVGVVGFSLGLRRLRVAVRLLAGSVGVLTLLAILLVTTPLGALAMRKFTTENLMTTGSWRLFSWIKAVSVFLKHPVFGVGLGYQHQFVRLAGDMQTLRVNEGNTIHNDILWVLVNTGTVGFVVLVVLWGRLIARAIQTIRRSTDLFLVAITAACLGELAVLIVTSLFQPTISLGSSGFLLGLLAALLCRTADLSSDVRPPSLIEPQINRSDFEPLPV
ncbi:MAG: O-antigen ligase family protein [Gemmatimonadaceae bacterium]